MDLDRVTQNYLHLFTQLNMDERNKMIEVMKEKLHPTMVNDKMMVMKRKGNVTVKYWGSAPIGVVKQCKTKVLSYVPNGFQMETFADKHEWVGRTKVSDAGLVEYCFWLKSDPQIKSLWFPNPTRAYIDVFTQLTDVTEEHKQKVVSSANGRLIIGVMYESLQQEIKKRFPVDTAIHRKRRSSVSPVPPAVKKLKESELPIVLQVEVESPAIPVLECCEPEESQSAISVLVNV